MNAQQPVESTAPSSYTSPAPSRRPASTSCRPAPASRTPSSPPVAPRLTADLDSLNLARRLRDGEQVLVPGARSRRRPGSADAGARPDARPQPRHAGPARRAARHRRGLLAPHRRLAHRRRPLQIRRRPRLAARRARRHAALQSATISPSRRDPLLRRARLARRRHRGGCARLRPMPGRWSRSAAPASASAGFLAGRRRDAVSWRPSLVLVALAASTATRLPGLPTQPGGVALLNDSGRPSRCAASSSTSRRSARRPAASPSRVDAYLDANGVWQPRRGRVLVTSRLYPAYAYGDDVRAHGPSSRRRPSSTASTTASTSPAAASSQRRSSRASKSSAAAAAATSRAGCIDVRRPLGDSLERALPEPESALARGILLGERASIPDDLTDDFNRAGISHLIAISG